jgi:hypothetical protein
MNVDAMSFVDGMSVGGRLFALSAEEFTTNEASVDVWRGFQGDGTGGFEVKVEEGSVDGVEVGAGCHDMIYYSYSDSREMLLL